MAKHSEVVAQLVVEAAIAGVAGTVRGKFPIAPVILNAQQCGELGLPPGSNTMFYPLDKSGVFYDVDEEARIVYVRSVRDKPPHASTEEIL